MAQAYEDLIDRVVITPDMLAVGMRVVYSDDFKQAWERSYLEGRSEWDEYDGIRRWYGAIVGLTTKAGIVTVESIPDETQWKTFKQVHIDNLAIPVYYEEEAA